MKINIDEKQERLERALKYGDFYELALITYEESGNENQH